MPYQTHWKEYCEENNTIYDSPTVEQFLNFLKKLFNQVVSPSVMVTAKSAVVHALSTYPSTPINNKIFQRDIYFETPLPNFYLGCANYV